MRMRLKKSLTVKFSFLFVCAFTQAWARFFSGRVVPPGRNEYLRPAGRTWSPQEAVAECEGDLECAGFTLRGPVKSAQRRQVAFFR